MSAGVGGGVFAISSLGATEIHLDDHPEGAALRIESPALSAVVAVSWDVAEALGAELLARATGEKLRRRAEARRRREAAGEGFVASGRTMAEIIRGEEAVL